MTADTREEIRQAAEADLYTFSRLTSPERLYGELHKDVFRWLMETEDPNQLMLLPRGHMKSHCIASWCAWMITKHPEITILYISATAKLAEDQLYCIKNILTSDVYRRYWPEMVNKEEGKRERWNNNEIAVDHPKRRAEGIRDATCSAAGITTNTTGSHADVVVADDVVVPANAYTNEGRKSVADAMSQIASILNTGGTIKACGTRYHYRDQYSVWKTQTIDAYDFEGQIVDRQPLWAVMEEVVEVDNIFLWPREQRTDGKWFGFDVRELARISALYTDRTQFYAQYYNNPNDPGSARMSRERFQYFDPRLLKNHGSDWEYNGERLNLFAGVDFAFSLKAKADYTAIVVIGIDCRSNIYVLDIDRFKSDKISEYYDHVFQLQAKWGFRKMRAEVTAAQQIIVNDLKDRLRSRGVLISIDEYRPTRNEGSKSERIAATLEPRYENMTMWHYKGGYSSILEEELIQEHPPNDDIKDCLAAVVSIATAPSYRRRSIAPTNRPKPNSIFGGFG